jgi:hypothetical protein
MHGDRYFLIKINALRIADGVGTIAATLRAGFTRKEE